MGDTIDSDTRPGPGPGITEGYSNCSGFYDNLDGIFPKVDSFGNPGSIDSLFFRGSLTEILD